MDNTSTSCLAVVEQCKRHGPLQESGVLSQRTPKVFLASVVKRCMNENNPLKLANDDPMWDIATVIENSVRAVRKAQGKKNPEDVAEGTPEHEEVLNDFLRDVLNTMAGDDADQSDDFGIGAAG